MSEKFSRSEFDLPFPPCVGTDGKAPIASLAVGIAAVTIDLMSIPSYGLGVNGSPPGLVEDPNVIGHMLGLQATGADVWYIFGPTLASVSGANAPNPATRTALAANLITPAVAICTLMAVNTYREYFLPKGNVAAGGAKGTNSPARWMSAITLAGTGVLVLTLSAKIY